jgi:hypothetical protein
LKAVDAKLPADYERTLQNVEERPMTTRQSLNRAAFGPSPPPVAPAMRARNHNAGRAALGPSPPPAAPAMQARNHNAGRSALGPSPPPPMK